MKQEKDRIRAKERYRQMSRREKIQHLWTYYRVPLIAVIIALVAAGSLASSLYQGHRSKNNLHFGLLGVPDSLGPAVEQLAADAGWSKGLSIASCPGADDEQDEGVIRIVVMLAADELDIALCDEETMEFIRVDQEIPISAWPVEETALAPYAPKGQELFVVVLQGTGRPDKTAEFARLLGCV